MESFFLKKQSPRIVIAAASSGSGKTTITLAILAALKKRKLSVQAYKCGPDYIDPGYHTAITGRVSRNLDSWFVKPDVIKKIFLKNSTKADISVIEGVMGLFDGKNPLNNSGSTAEISRILNAPVLLVLDAKSMARSAAAIVKGFQVFDRKIQIAGVILNKCGSKNHIEILREAIEKECKVPVLGGVLADPEILVPERHLGLLPAMERGELDNLFHTLEQIAEKSIDLDKIIEIANSAPKFSPEIFNSSEKLFAPFPQNTQKIHIAIAHDLAFNFYYPENIDLLRKFNMKPVFFSPLKNEPVPEIACGLYLGGGFPEEFAGLLSKNNTSMKSIIKSIEGNMPVLAECGGFMYLTKNIITGKITKKMCGIIPGNVEMQKKRAALGYREITGVNNNFLLPDSTTIRGHEFHYSKYIPFDNSLCSAFHVTGRNVSENSGFLYKNLVAGYPHLYFLSHPDILKNWYKKCIEYKNGKLVRGI
jgi:cobyrinic acid a,c-diamide synthase